MTAHVTGQSQRSIDLKQNTEKKLKLSIADTGFIKGEPSHNV